MMKNVDLRQGMAEYGGGCWGGLGCSGAGGGLWGFEWVGCEVETLQMLHEDRQLTRGDRERSLGQNKADGVENAMGRN